METEPAPAPPAAAVPDSTVAQAADSNVGVTEAEIAAMEQELAAQATEADGYQLDLYGFADFSYGVALNKFALAPPFNSFAVGHLNVYIASKLGDRWQSLAEVRFSYLPHGAAPLEMGGSVTRNDTTVPDYADLNRPIRWGAIAIERAYLEYLAHPLVNVRVGHFLTPYGIWNVDHGSPVIIGARRPFVVGASLLPAAQTGVEIYGTHHFDPVRVGYHLTLSNGRGPVDTYQDLNDNKAIGGRLYAHADTPAGSFTLGASGYLGRYTDRTIEFGIDTEGNLRITEPITLDYKEASLAADLKWELDGFLFQGEAMMNDVVYDQVRSADPLVFEGPPGFLPDQRSLGAYFLTGYRFDFIGSMPFFGLEYYDAGRDGMGTGKSAALWGGLNVRPTPRVVLKAQYTYSWYPGGIQGIPEEDAHYNAIDLQAAWSF